MVTSIRFMIFTLAALLLLPEAAMAQRNRNHKGKKTHYADNRQWNHYPQDTYRNSRGDYYGSDYYEDDYYDDDFDYYDDWYDADYAYPVRHGNKGYKGRKGYHIPRGHYPAPGMCRIWYPGTPPGHQPPPMRCRRLRGHVPAGAVILTHQGIVNVTPSYRTQRVKRVYFNRPHYYIRHQRPSATIIIDVIGRRKYEELDARRHRMGIQAPLSGRLVASRRGGFALQIHAGDYRFAEYRDYDGNGRADVLLASW